ncbi:hypothetical protein C8R47DRAFT_968792 [Mycena vitilis]|nr:hypothetical protein C8R47DRAFT_968792 [Mycena vitilis]
MTSRITTAFVTQLNSITTRSIVFKSRELESALMRPAMVSYDTPNEATSERLAAELAYGIIMNHPFVDGNKRTAFLAANELLREKGTPMVNLEPAQALTQIELVGQAHSKVAMGQMDVLQLADVYARILGAKCECFESRRSLHTH